MSPTDLEEFIISEPFVPLRLTLSSGDSVILESAQRILMTGLTIHYLLTDNPESRIGKKVRIISIPNIVLVEPVDPRHHRDGGRRR